MNVQGWFPLGLNDLISLQSKGLSRVFSSTTVQNRQFFWTQSLQPNLHFHSWLLEKTSVQFSSVAQSCLILCDTINCSMPGTPVYHQLLESTQTHVHWVGNAIQPSHPLSSPSLIFNLSTSIRVFSNESTLRSRSPNYWSFSFSIRPSNEHSGLISFRMDWLDLLAVQGTLKSFLQHHRSKASILQH